VSAPDVTVVGGGAIGLCIAWRSAGHGATVTVVDPAPGRSASWAAAGMLAPVTEVHYGEEPLLELNLASSSRWPSFAEELGAAAGADVGLVECGTLAVARDSDDNEALSDLFDFQQRLGLGVARLSGRECRALEPSLASSTRGGILVEGDHQVDNRALVESLHSACRAAGVTFVLERVHAIEVSGERAAGVVTDAGMKVSSGSVVIAAGAGSGSIGGLPVGARPPVRPVKGQLLHLRGPAEDILFTHNLRGAECYLVARPDGRVVLGATVEERGFDERPTAGGIFELLRASYELVPGITELELTEIAVGLRPGTPDNAPLLGPGALEGLVFACGHYRNGILLTPVTGDAIAAFLAGHGLPPSIEPFSPRRFEPVDWTEPVGGMGGRR
jgi:glycine oxidase